MGNGPGQCAECAAASQARIGIHHRSDHAQHSASQGQGKAHAQRSRIFLQTGSQPQPGRRPAYERHRRPFVRRIGGEFGHESGRDKTSHAPEAGATSETAGRNSRRREMRVIAQLVLTFLLNASWQIALLVAFATLCDWLLRGLVARYRHSLWVITLVSCLVLPLLSCAPLTKTLWRNQQTNAAVAAKPFVISRILSPDVEEIESSNSEAPASSIKAETGRRIFSRSPIHVTPSIA